MISYGLLLFAMYILNLLNKTQLSHKNFIENYYENTTAIDVYDDKTAYIYLNNKTISKFYITIGNKTEFYENLKTFPYEVLHKEPYNGFKWIIDFVMMAIFLGTLLKFNQHSGIRNSIYTEEKKVKTTLKDIAGLEEIQKDVFEFIDFLKNRDKYEKVGARMPRGALFHGPPGTGKTLLAKAIAGETNATFFSVSGSDFSEMYVGVGSARVRDLFKKAREKAPSVVFIDEIDAIARSRNNSSHHEKDNTLNRLLIEMDGFSPNDNVLIFGATNRVDILDKALLRPGRFDRKIAFELPEKSEREKIYYHYLKNMRLSSSPTEMADMLAKQSCGFSSAEISNMCNEACILSVRNKSDLITKEILVQALDNIMLGAEKKTFRLSDKERKIVAYHESGHTLISYLYKSANMPIKVSIMPRGKSALGFSQTEPNDSKLLNKDQIFEKMCVLLGGRVAEEIFCENITTGACDDLERLTNLAYKYVSIFSNFHFQKEDKIYSEKLRMKMDKSVQKIIEKAYKKTKKTMIKNKKLVEKMTKKLLEKETLLQTDLDIIFNEIE